MDLTQRSHDEKPFSRAALSVLLFSLCASATQAAEIRGQVVNARGGEPLGQVQISVLESHLETNTNEDGSFVIQSIPPGHYTLRVNAVGYHLLTIPFSLLDNESKEFSITLVTDNFRRTDIVEVTGDIFQGAEPAEASHMELTGMELKQSSTVLLDDPFRAIQSLPGVSASENNDFFAQFSVMGAPFDKIAVYFDDIPVRQPFHGLPNERQGASLSLLSSETVEEVKLMPIAFPERYGDASGAALDIRTREGSRTKPLFHGSIGIADSDFLGEGRLGGSNRGSWLASVRKSYLGYLTRRSIGDTAPDISFYDADGKLTYDLSNRQTVDLYGLYGHADLGQASPSSRSNPNALQSGGNNFTLARAGWKYGLTSNLVLNARAAYIRQLYDKENSFNQKLSTDYYGEWIGSATAVWNWSKSNVLEGGGTWRRLRDSGYDVVYTSEPDFIDPGDGTLLRQSGYVQQASSFLHERLHLLGGVRWDHLQQENITPVSPQASLSWQVASSTQVQLGFGRYAQFPDIRTLLPPVCIFSIAPLIERADHYTAAIEQRIGEHSRIRIEAFDREDRDREGDRTTAPDTSSACAPLNPSRRFPVSLVRDHSRGVQIILQRRSANRLSGWIGYTLDFSRQRGFFDPVYSSTPEADQRHTVNAFATYRLTSSINLSGKALYGSGFPVFNQLEVIGNGIFSVGNPVRLGPYERLDLRIDKSLSSIRWKFTLYGEVLNVTNHQNLRFINEGFDSKTRQTVLHADRGLPVTPTAGVAFEF